MLSYQHAYHAGNLADLHKHALLARMLAYMTAKPKPLSYLETHAGRGLYALDGAEARKTGEAEAGALRAQREGWLPADHPLALALATVRARHGAASYPGSPLLAAHFLRAGDAMHLAELHPAEAGALAQVMPADASLHRRDGFEMAKSLIPPMPRRGLMLIDPSYEMKADYDAIPDRIAGLARKWIVGVIALWYPILTDARHRPMVGRLRMDHPEALISEVGFTPARPGHGMVGSGMFVLNPPWGLEGEARFLNDLFAAKAG